jgi:hypothetical protein
MTSFMLPARRSSAAVAETGRSRVAFGREGHRQAENPADVGIGKTVGELCAPSPPIEALHLVGGDDASHRQAAGNCYLERISLDSAGYGTAQGQIDHLSRPAGGPVFTSPWRLRFVTR